ncbi:MAG TPA: tetratricopeptide repeat protein [Bryobacteraceae bacterium]|nr:tetratricopeptide repeat protein [Bryobacteraceae bacterium]
MIAKFWKTASVVTLALLTTPALLFPQNTKEQLVSLQRDVAQLQDQIRQLQKAQADQIAALTALVQQAVDESRKGAAMSGGVQRTIDQKLTDLQAKLVAPVATLGSKVDTVAEDFRTMQTNVAELTRLVRKMDDKLNDISTAVRTLNAPPPAPQSATAPDKPGPPAGVTAEVLYQNGYRDYMGKKDELALQEFNEYLKYFDKNAQAPTVQFYIGNLYDRANQYDDAAQAFDAVLTRFPENEKTAEAMYMKGVMLQKGRHKTDAGAVFQEFLRKYPGSPFASKAREHLKELGLSAPGARPSGSRKKDEQ